jgi:hypothetical protein
VAQPSPLSFTLLVQDLPVWPLSQCAGLLLLLRYVEALRKPRENLGGNEANSLLISGCVVLEGIEEPDKNFLFDQTCRYNASAIVLFPTSLADSHEARIITHAPLRAKEASPFVNNKYPVVVCALETPDVEILWD